MKAMKISLFASVFGLALLVPGQPRLADAPSAVATKPIVKRPGALADQSANARNIESLAQRLVAEKNLPGLAMAIVQDGQIISMKGYGLTDSQQGSPVMPYTVFRLASLSKGFASTLSGQLVEEGAMSWDSPIINQLPAFKLKDFASGTTVTVRDVLSHRVGLRDHTYDGALAGDQPYALIAERLSDAPMTCSPGDCYGYQNIAYSLIGDLTFAATGDFYPHQVEKRIFVPLGMSNASYGLDGLMSSASWAKPHVRGKAGSTGRPAGSSSMPRGTKACWASTNSSGWRCSTGCMNRDATSRIKARATMAGRAASSPCARRCGPTP